MSAEQPLTVRYPDEPPALTPEAAWILLRILRKHAKSRGAKPSDQEAA